MSSNTNEDLIHIAVIRFNKVRQYQTRQKRDCLAIAGALLFLLVLSKSIKNHLQIIAAEVGCFS